MLLFLLSLDVGTCLPAALPDDWTESTTLVAAGQTVPGDLFAADEVVEIAGVVDGDVFAAGRRVHVSGTVKGDLLAAAEVIAITGRVEQDARVAGRAVIVAGSVGKNVTALAETFEVSDRASVDGSILGAVQSAVLSGPVGLDVRLAATSLQLDARVGGKVDAMVETLVIASSGTVERDLTYWSRNDATVVPGANIKGTLIRRDSPWAVTEKADGSPPDIGALILKAVSFCAMLLTGLLIIHFFPIFTRRAADTVGQRTLLSLGIGFVALVVLPAASLMLFITVVGIPLALLVLTSYAVGLYLVRIFAAFWLGRALLVRVQPEVKDGWSFTLGLAILFALSLVPYAGFAVQASAVLVGLGAVLITEKDVYEDAQRSGLL